MNKVVVAQYDYIPDDNTSFLTLKEGDKIIVLDADNESGWWQGILTRTGQKGLFPATFVSDFILPSTKKHFHHHQYQESHESIDSLSHSELSNLTSTTNTNNAKQSESIDIPTIIPKQNTIALDIQNNLTINSIPKNIKKQSHDIDINTTAESYYYLNLKINPNSKSRFGLTSHYMSIFASISTIFCGISSYFWSNGSEYLSEIIPNFEVPFEITMYGFELNTYLIASLYSISIGLIMIIWEYFFGYTRSNYCIPFRSLFYLFISLSLFTTFSTGMCGLLWFNAFIFSLIAWKKNEIYLKAKKKHSNKQKRSNESSHITRIFCCKLFSQCRKQSKCKKYLFVTIYLIFNILFVLYWVYHYFGFIETINFKARKGKDQTLKLTLTQNGNNLILNYWFPIAKGFGKLLNINCAFILLPVCRTFISKLYNISTDQRTSARFCNTILSFMPLDKALQFHKLCAFLIIFGTIFHTFAHFNQISFVPASYEQTYGLTVWISGVLIIIIIQLIFCTSLMAVRHGKFELFWFTHHLFIVFFILILFHGKNSLNPNFWKWFIIPGLLYISERVIRELNARKPVGIISVTHMNNYTKTAKVFCLELEKKGPIRDHKEGQYVFIKAPIISKYQWHPFTISSPPDKKTLTLHIRNMGNGTWTDRLQQLFQAMAPTKAYSKLYHRDGGTLVPKTIGPDGNNLICIDGPIAAPTQHLGRYDTSIIIGAGIGVTPLRATLQSIVFYRFKKGIGNCYPDNCCCCWIVNYKQLEAYRFMCRTLKEIEDELYNMRVKNQEQMKTKSIQIHIFVTSIPPKQEMYDNFDIDDVLNLKNDRQRDMGLWGSHYYQDQYDDLEKKESPQNIERCTAPFSEIDIWRCLKLPVYEKKQIGDIIVHRGRPKWREIFGPMQSKYKGHDIGCMYCGPEIIAKDLKKTCGDFTNFDTKTRFILHKENF